MTSSDPWRRTILARSIVIIVLAGVIGYYGFVAVNTIGVGDRTGPGIVVSKQYVPPGTTYVTQIVNGRPYPLAQVTPDQYVLLIDLPGGQTAAAVAKALYDSVGPGDQVRVTFRRLRLTGALQVVDVRR